MLDNQLDIILSLTNSAISDYLNEKVIITSFIELGGGCINNAFKLETSKGLFFVKWNHSSHADIFICEAEGLKELVKATDGQIVIPKVIAAKEINETPGYLILEYLEPAQIGTINDVKLGQGLARIHQFRNENFGFHANNHCGKTIQNNIWNKSWVEIYRDNRIGWLLNEIEKYRYLSVTEKRMFEKFRDRLRILISEDEKPALIHGDLWSGNYMHTKQGPALIDPAVSYCNREMEFGMITLFGGFSQRFFDAYNEVYRLPYEWKSRNPLYQLYHILNHFLLFDGSYMQQAIQIVRNYL